MTLVLSLVATLLFAAFGSALAVATITESAISRSFREGAETFHAAEGAVELALRDLSAEPDWGALDEDGATSAFVDGPPSGSRRAGAVSVDLGAATDDINVLARLRYGAAAPVYRLYGWGPLSLVAPGSAARSSVYLTVWIADLSGVERQAGDAARPVIGLIGRAYGTNGGRRSVAVAVVRDDPADGAAPGAMRLIWWHELR